jgi:hypothetical protein
MCDFDVDFDNLIEMAASTGQFTPTANEVRAERDTQLIQTAVALAKVIRPLVRTSTQLLFHGTPYPRQILKDNALKCSNADTFSVHFTRELAAATFFALLDEHDNDDGIGAILVFDRDRLAQDYRLTCFRDKWLDEIPYLHDFNEADERVCRRDVARLHRYLHDTIWVDEKRQQIWSEKQVRDERGAKPINWPGRIETMAFHGDSGLSSRMRLTAEDVGESAAHDTMGAVIDRLLHLLSVGVEGRRTAASVPA